MNTFVGGEDAVLGKIIVLENICTRGYFNSPSKVNIPLEYAVAGLRSIARFHGNSYLLKETEPERFSEIRQSIIKIRFSPEDENFYQMLKKCSERASDALERRNYDPVFVERIKILFNEDLVKTIIECIDPREPLATIIHGDCTINNILFRREGPGEGDPWGRSSSTSH